MASDESTKLARDLEKLRQHRDVIRNLASVASGPVTSLGAFLDELVLRVAQAVEIDHVKLLRFRPEKNDLFLEAGFGWKEGTVKTATFPTDLASPPGRAFRTGHGVLIRDLAEARGYRISPVLSDHGIVCLLNVPVIVDGIVWGVLEADSTTPFQFSSDTEEFLHSAAGLGGLVICRAELERSRQDDATAAREEVKHRALLLAEMQHRVRNNFQTIVAMIVMRKEGLGAEFADELVNAVIAMSIAHEQLSKPGSGDRVNLSNYLEALASSLEKANDKLVIEVQTDELLAGVDEAVSLGLITNEAVRNAVKHDPSSEQKVVRLQLCAVGAAEAFLSIKSKGIADGSRRREPGSGTRLMQALARRIQSNLMTSITESEVEVRVTFPRRPQQAVRDG